MGPSAPGRRDWKHRRTQPSRHAPGDSPRRPPLRNGLRKEGRGAVSGAVGCLAGSIPVDVDAVGRFGREREWAVGEASLCMGMCSVGVGRRQAGGAVCIARALIGNVLRDRELRCPADDWGRTPVVCGMGTFWMGNAVLDWRPPVFRAAVEAGQCRLVGVGAGAVLVASRRLPTRRRGSARKSRATRGSRAQQTCTTAPIPATARQRRWGRVACACRARRSPPRNASPPRHGAL